VLAPDLVAAYSRGWEATLQELRDLIGARAPVDLCGLSLGGLAALHVASTHPRHVGRLIVCAGFWRLPPRLRRRVRMLGWAAGLMPRGLLHRGVVADLPEPHRPRARAEIALLRPRQFSRLMREAAGVEVDAARIAADTLVLCGERDRANTPLAVALARAVPRATFRLVPDAGHIANLDNPAGFTALLAEFLSAPDL
jgi:pimeloyl-ACP methyl ester carboxylesterase